MRQRRPGRVEPGRASQTFSFARVQAVSVVLPELAAEWYTRPENFSREKRGVFASAWLLLCRRASLSRPGDFVALNIAGWPVVAMQDETGTVAAFRNVCRHQGLPIFDNGAGHCEGVARCRYHGWTYDLNGHFAGSPPGAAPAKSDDPLHNLQPVTTLERQGLLFVNLDDRGFEAAKAIEPASTAPLSGLAFRQEHALEIQTNWKLAMERYLASSPPPGTSRSWHWPNLVLDVAPSGAVVHQLVPRSFQRTRIVRHIYDTGVADYAAIDAEIRSADSDQVASEAEYAALASGTRPERQASAALADFRDLIRRIHGNGKSE